MTKLTRNIVVFLAIAALALAACQAEVAGKGPRTATTDEIVNVVEARTSGAVSFNQARPGFELTAGGQIQTGNDSSVRLKFDDGSIVRLSEQTTFTLTGNDGSGTAHGTLDFGKLWVSLASGKLEVETPSGVASVRGSYAVFDYLPGDNPESTDDDVLTVSCLEGTCQAGNGIVDVELTNLEQVVITNGGKSAEKMTLHDYDVQQFLQVNPESGGIVATLTAAPPKNENGNTIYGTARATMNENDRATRDAARATAGKPGKGPDGTPGPNPEKTPGPKSEKSPGPKAEKTPGPPSDPGNGNGGGSSNGNDSGVGDDSGGGGGGGGNP